MSASLARCARSEVALGKRFADLTVLGTIVGVVGHVRSSGVEVDPRPQFY
jgi:hypothetical protein